MKKILLIGLLISQIVLFKNTLEASQIIAQDDLMISDTCEKIDQYLTRLTTEKNFSGELLIIRGDRKMFSKCYGWADREKNIPLTPDIPVSIGSITKAFTAAAIMKLVEQGKLQTDDKLIKFFPEIPEDKASITLHQLLTHSAGFHEFLKSDGGDYEKIESREFLERAFREPLAFVPGTKAVYTNVGFSLLGIIIEKVSGLDYEQFLKKFLFDPIGIKNSGYHYPVDRPVAVGYQNGVRWGTHQERFARAGGGPYWNLKANGGLEVPLDDMYLWLSSFKKHTVLSAESIRTMFTPFVQEEGYGGDSWFGYGCNISKSRRNTTVISNGGSNGIYFARIARFPEEDVIFYLVTNESSVNANKVLPNISQLYFNGRIDQDALASEVKFNDPLAEKIYSIVINPSVTDLGSELSKENLRVEDDMILLEVGQKLLEEGNYDKAFILYTYYTQTFPAIVVAWNDLGDVYLKKGNKEQALHCYRKALELRPENQRAKESIKRLSDGLPE